jgi:hypothetical protein
MALKFEVNRLASDELSYELEIRIRGIVGLATVAEMRKTLRNLLRLEKSPTPLTYPDHPYTFEEDVTAVAQKLDEIGGLVESFEGVRDATYAKIISKIAHALGRVNKSRADYNDRLFDKIRQRTQGSDETIGLYLAVMDSLFDRLTIKVAEPVRLKIILRNLSPFYQSQIGVHPVRSRDELLGDRSRVGGSQGIRRVVCSAREAQESKIFGARSGVRFLRTKYGSHRVHRCTL